MTPNLNDLDPLFRDEAKDFFKTINQSAEYKYNLTCVKRSFEEQDALWAQGRKPLEEVNTLRAKASMPPITEEENKRVVTWTMKSKHLPNLDGYSEAFDIAAILRETGQYLPDDDAQLHGCPYLLAYIISKDYLHIKAGYEFKVKDKCHYELRR